MFYALGILVLGIFLGRLGQKRVSKPLISGLVLFSIFLLLFLLGVSIGANQKLLARLPDLGLEAFLIMLACVGGSIIFSAVITPFLAGGKKGAPPVSGDRKDAD